MKRERYQQIEQLLHAALERPPEERAAFIEQSSGGDEELCREVKSLMAYDDRAARFIETPPGGFAAALLAEEQEESMLGRTLSHYQVLAFLGAGGMGEVHLALDTQLNRKVAIKLLPPEFTADVERVRRFE